MPNARVATTATCRYSTGGCWAAREMSQAEVAIRPIAQPRAAVPASDGEQHALRRRVEGDERRTSGSRRSRAGSSLDDG